MLDVTEALGFSTIQYNTTVKLVLNILSLGLRFSTIQYNTTVKPSNLPDCMRKSFQYYSI